LGYEKQDTKTPSKQFDNYSGTSAKMNEQPKNENYQASKMVSYLTQHDFQKNGPIRTNHTRLFDSLIEQSDKKKYCDYYFHDYYNKIIFNRKLILKFWYDELEAQTNFYSLKQISLEDFYCNGLKAFENIYGTSHPLLLHFMGFFEDEEFEYFDQWDPIYKKYDKITTQLLSYNRNLNSFNIEKNYLTAIIVFVMTYVIEESQKYEVVLEDNIYILKKKEATGNLSRFIINTLSNFPEQKIHISKLLHLINRSNHIFEITKPVSEEWLRNVLIENTLKFYYRYDEKTGNIIKSIDVDKFYQFLIDNPTDIPFYKDEKPDEVSLSCYSFIGKTFPLEIADQYVKIRPIFLIATFGGRSEESDDSEKKINSLISELFEKMLKDNPHFEKKQIEVREFIKENVRISRFSLVQISGYFADSLQIDSDELSLADIKELLIIYKQPLFNTEMPEYNIYYTDLKKYLDLI